MYYIVQYMFTPVPTPDRTYIQVLRSRKIELILVDLRLFCTVLFWKDSLRPRWLPC